MGRLTKDPDTRYTQGEKSMTVSRYTLAVDRKYKKKGEDSADFISCVAFGKNGEFAEKYLRQGIKIVVCGHIQTGSYTNKDGQKVYTTDVVVEEHEFAESKSTGTANNSETNVYSNPLKEETAENQPPLQEGFMTIPEGIEEELPFM